MAPCPHSAQALNSRRTRGIQSYRCRVCCGIHPLRKCQMFLKLRAVLINKYCANCLAHKHSTGSCRSGVRCKTYDRNHHSLLHMHEHVSRKSPLPSNRQDPTTSQTLAPPPRSASSTPAPSIAALLQRHSVNVLSTALVIVETEEKKFDTAALIDPCTPTSSIDFASAFCLSTTNMGEESICTAKVDEAIKMEVVLKIEPNVWIRTPIPALSESVVKKFRALPLADERFHRPDTISLILGAEVYPKVIQPGFHMVDEGKSVAQKTVFGWILSGACTQA
ncbi:uncharacterized protein LOC119561879 [Drosophila subpulchrella]|uniref:uncharacterized protein LOC119561879 n=1 Tax=Drosophila subpulchrella TaxID=1486046 RepID=UPI0018A15250|nr:uncharacterized protein LOC119561879 [Drosophila subpulchrella]